MFFKKLHIKYAIKNTRKKEKWLLWISQTKFIENECNKHEKTFCRGYGGFVYPYTVSFCNEGKYKVVIKGKRQSQEKLSKAAFYWKE